jgi:signal peptidase I
MLFRYQGGSMWPLLREGDLLVVESVPPDKVRRRDCILYRDSRTAAMVVHRVKSVGPGIVTRGDTRGVDDCSPVTPSRLVGLGRF